MFIDDRGRLFGKINMIDFVVILVFLSLIPAGIKITNIMINLPPKAAEPEPLQLYVRWQISEAIKNSVKENFDLIEIGKVQAYDKDNETYVLTSTESFYYGYSWVEGDDKNQIGQTIAHEDYVLNGVIVKTRKGH